MSSPPLLTLLEDLAGWSLDRSAGLPKAQRHTFGQRLDNGVLESLRLATRARFGSVGPKRVALRELNLQLEELRVLWRLVCRRGWISRQQNDHVQARLDEAGRMAGGWLRELDRRPPADDPPDPLAP